MKVYVDELPEACGKCRFIGHYENGIYSRNPHCCCELYWDLHQEEIRVDKNSRDERCPFNLLSDRLAGERKKVVELFKNMSTINNTTMDIVGKFYTIPECFLDHIERGEL